MELNEVEKRLIFQTESYGRNEVIKEIHQCIPYIPTPEKRKTAKELVCKLERMPTKECKKVIEDIKNNYQLPSGPKTVGELLADARRRSGATKLKGHDIMGLERFEPQVTHMVIFDVLSKDSMIGDKGDRMRLFLSDEGYQKFLDKQSCGEIKIQNHAKVSAGFLHYDRKDKVL